MAAKRFLQEAESDQDKPASERRMKPRPSLASVIGEVVMVNNSQSMFSTLEPLFRRVVNEEIERAVSKYSSDAIVNSPSLRIQSMEQQSSNLQLIFSKKLSLPIFTGSKILDADNKQLQILLVEKSGDRMIATSLPHAIRLEIVVLDGDFPPSDYQEMWTSEAFNNCIVKERNGKRPLLTGELNLTMRDGAASVGDIEFTDNSSWIRSRRFRVAVRVVPGRHQGVRIHEAITEAFMVKDHRGELYKKHHPPRLTDDVWRLEKIGKEGAFHKKLSLAGINTVQDFLKLSVVDPVKLRNILGVGMSEKMWDATIKHARTCVLDNKVHIFRENECVIHLNPICQVVKAEISGQTYSASDITKLFRNYIEKLVRKAYATWNSLEVVDGVPNGNSAATLLTQGDQMMQQYMAQMYGSNEFTVDKSVEIGYQDVSNVQIGSTSDWQMNQEYQTSFGTAIHYSISESSSDGDITPRDVFHERVTKR